ILQFLYPRDLLTMTGINKATRKILLCKANRRFWTSALAKLRHLPPCPPHLSEPHYVALIFGGNCMVSSLFTPSR
ncbi:hypothetical protein C8Q79DRAFT_901595, partial [Trametes meyenii]